jgi:Protein of unknown function (DUF541)
MPRFLPSLLLAVCCSVAFGQIEPNSITVTASNNVNLQPDQAIFSVVVQSGLNTGLDDVLTAVQSVGLTAANLANVSTLQAFTYVGQQNTPSIQWTFTLLAPLAQTKTTVATLTALQQSIMSANNGLTLSFNITGTQISQQLAQSQTCSLTALIADATTQAQSLANASGLHLGSITAISGSTATTMGTASPSPYAYINPQPCLITVRFAAARF